jgi:hypothetical protein
MLHGFSLECVLIDQTILMCMVEEEEIGTHLSSCHALAEMFCDMVHSLTVAGFSAGSAFGRCLELPITEPAHTYCREGIVEMKVHIMLNPSSFIVGVKSHIASRVAYELTHKG